MASKVKRFFKRAGLTAAIMLVSAAAFVAHEWYAKPFFINNFFNRAFIQFVWDKPEFLTSMGILEQLGITGHNAKWNDDSEAASDREYEMLLGVMATLDEYDEAKLSDAEILSVKVLKELFGNSEDDRKFRHHDYPVNQLFGLQNSIPRFLDTFHRISSSEDAEHYISRLSKIGIKMNQNMEGLLIREEKGVIPPTFVIEKSVAIMQEFVGQPAEENVLYVSFAGKLEQADAIVEADRTAFLDSAKTEIENVVYPAYQEYIDYFTSLRVKSDDVAGVWNLPDGEAYYNYLLRGHTTTDMTAEEIHAVGVAEVDRIQSEMLEIFAAEGYDRSLGVKTLFGQLAEEERFYYPDTDAGRAQILEDYATIIKEIEAGISDAFNVKPKAGIAVKRVPEFSEETAPGAYYNGPSRDGSRPGTFYANLFDIRVDADIPQQT